MSLVLELHFATESEEFVLNLMRQLKDMELPSNLLEKSVPPHLTLLAAKSFPESMMASLDDVLAKVKRFSIKLVSLSTFANDNGVLFLGAVVDKNLLAIHETVHACYETANDDCDPYYLTARWVPHVTLATKYTREQLAKAMGGLELSLPVTLNVSGVALVEYPSLVVQKHWALAS